ncbi:hypothetical protein DA803_01005 [[Mycoplasma] phocae]|uniref:Uncharacterized protein n=2 Tax=[Mycoplasma] phocae TaxID=142651 RepID=A0A2Z5IQ00_9BACT|nr:hypothetical protein DA803_01005 [[Mycoplasma] phocae]
MVSSNLEKLVEKSTNKIKVLKAEAISFDDLEGILSLSITGSYNNQNFSINDYQITGFQNYSALKNLTNFIVSINKNSLIEDNKTNQDISSFVNHDLLKYLNINSNNISLNDLFNRKIIELEYANLNRKKDRLTFSFNYLYKSKKMGKIQNIEKISIIGTRIFVSNEKINDKDILNFLLDKKVKIKENLNKKIFASVYEGRENNAKNSIVSTFFEFDENDNKKYFKEQNGLLSIQIDKIKSNDVEGFLLISYFVKYENENSKTKIIKLENFLNAKNDNDLKSEFFLTTTNNNKFKQNLENLYKQYENDANAKNIKINDTSSLMKYFGFVLDWSIIREDDNQLQDKFMVDDTKSYWEFKYKNMKISDLLNTRSGILLEDSRTNKDKIIFNLLQVKPLEISNLIINKQEKSLTADFIYEIKFFVYNSNNIESKNTSEISVTQKTKITWKQQN